MPFVEEEAMIRFVVFLLIWLAAAPAGAVVEIGLEGQPPQRFEEVYHREGRAYLAIDDVLPVLGLSGRWLSVKHVYQISTPSGVAVISPGSHFLRLGDQLTPLGRPPRFIDGRLRISEDFIQRHLAGLASGPVFYRNLDPGQTDDPNPGSELDRLFAFLLKRDSDSTEEVHTATRIAIDPGHGGEDPGAIGVGGVKEKTVTLAVAQGVEKQLKMRQDMPVFLTRDDDYFLSREQRLQTLARSDADLLLVLHAQASFSSEPHGIVLFVRPSEEVASGALSLHDDSMRLAETLKASLEAAGLPVAGILRAPLLPLGRGDLPTVLVEMGYLTHVNDQARLSVKEGQKAMSAALFEGINTFVQTKQKEIL
jgi:N-acetylmuramoyl-L-alanine amidase